MSATLLEGLIFLVLAALVVSYGWVLYRAWASRRAQQGPARDPEPAASEQDSLAAAPEQQTPVSSRGEEHDVH